MYAKQDRQVRNFIQNGVVVVALALGACGPDMKQAKIDASSGRYEQAAVAWQELSEFGLPEAKSNLGLAYLQGQGVAKDVTKGRALMLEGAVDSNPRGIFELGRAYQKGLFGAPNYAEAMTLYKHAADDLDFPRASYQMGTMYEKGQGVSKDMAKARELYKKAADRGIGSAIGKLDRLDNPQAKSDTSAETPE
jgi:uncharacterized protein